MRGGIGVGTSQGVDGPYFKLKLAKMSPLSLIPCAPLFPSFLHSHSCPFSSSLSFIWESTGLSHSGARYSKRKYDIAQSTCKVSRLCDDNPKASTINYVRIKINLLQWFVNDDQGVGVGPRFTPFLQFRISLLVFSLVSRRRIRVIDSNKLSTVTP